MNKVDKVIFGAGIYGLYAAIQCAKKKEKVIVLEYDDAAFSRASYINQSRIHNGYHSPRSISTALSASKYFRRFSEEFDFCIQKEFHQLYAISKKFSWVNSQQFIDFCKATNIYYKKVGSNSILKKNSCEEIFETREYAFDAIILKEYLLNQLSLNHNCKIHYNSRVRRIDKRGCDYYIEKEDGNIIVTRFILNATYSSINQVQALLGFEPFKINYELCEIILCKVSDQLKNIGITVMDGPFFSLMPFGKSGYHALSAVHYTPHKTYEGHLPKFNCQTSNVSCDMNQLENCNQCINKPLSNWIKMYKLLMKYIDDEIKINYIQSIYAMKAVLIDSEIDDSRPTIVKQFSEKPYFYSVLSGKINCIYELDEILV